MLTAGTWLVFTATTVVPAALVHPLTVTVKLYVPAMAVVADDLTGFCNVDVNPPGPDQLYIAPATAEVVRLMLFPVHTGLLLVVEGVEGKGVIPMLTVAIGLVHPPTVTVSE
jgi:hypothetical protein